MSAQINVQKTFCVRSFVVGMQVKCNKKNQLKAGVEETALQIKMGMPVMKEIGAHWLIALYNKFRSENSIIINRFKNVGIIEAIRKAREGPHSDADDESSNDSDDDPFDSLELEEY